MLLTRPTRSHQRLRHRLVQLGASVVHIPTVELVPTFHVHTNVWDSPYCTLAFSSQNAWAFFLEMLEENKESFPKDLPLFSIGPATTQAMAGYENVIQADVRNGVGLATAVRNHFGTTPVAPVLFPCSEQARTTFEEKLEEYDIQVRRLEIYKPVTVEPGPIPIEVARPTWVIFASPSAVVGYAEHLHPIENIKIACMGSTTAAAAKNAGLSVELMPPKPGTEEMAQALAEYQNETRGQTDSA